MSTDFAFFFEGEGGPEGPGSHLRVVSFSGREAISDLRRYDILLTAHEPAPPVDPEDLVGQRATLRIATLTEPAVRPVQGVVTEAEEMGLTQSGVLYRVRLESPLVRAAHRTRSRIFLDKTLRRILEAVLLGDPRMEAASSPSPQTNGDRLFADYRPAAERFTLRVRDTSRLDSPEARPYVVQYNESDLAFLSRLLEEEGLRYHFEDTDSECLLVISDSDEGALHPEMKATLGPERLSHELLEMRLGQRLRAHKVSLAEYNWKRPALAMGVDLPAKPAGQDLFEATYPGLYPDAPEQGKPLATARLDRLRSEARFAALTTTCRTISAGQILDVHHEVSRYQGEYLVTAMEVHGESMGELLPGASTARRDMPYRAILECARRGTSPAPEDSHFRPARRTPKPRILGSQTAFVTAEPRTRGAEIHVGGPPGVEIGCVRLRFHWDTETARLDKEPSSAWVRVSQLFAGAGEGAVWHPRVGVEVVCEFLDGDPDRPLVTGRVYNGKSLPPTSGSGAPTVSLFKSLSTPGGKVYNELSFDDAAGNERVHLHAGKNWSAEVGHDRTESVTNDSTSDVGVHRSESTGGDRSTTVKGNNTESVSGDEAITVGGKQTLSVGADQTLSVGACRAENVVANDTLGVGGNRSMTIGGDRSEAIGGSAEQAIGGKKSVSVGGLSVETVGGSRSIGVGGSSTHAASGDYTLGAGGDVAQNAAGSFTLTSGGAAGVQSGGAMSLLAGGDLGLQAPNIYVTGAGEIVLSAGGGSIKLGGGGVEISGGTVKMGGGSVEIAGGVVKVN
ncbi:MAG: type VI secretion system tip protein TssI/VgrG [Polyangiaceae bacterium]